MATTVPLIDRAEFLDTLKGDLEIDPKKTACIQIDIHRRQIDPRFSPFPVDYAQRVIAASAEMMRMCRAAGIPVIHVMVYKREIETSISPRLGVFRRIDVNRSPYGPDLAYDPGQPEGYFTWDVMPELGPVEGDYIINNKKTLSAFHHTDLEILLKSLGTETILLTGINTNTCLQCATFDAANRGYTPVFIEEAIGSGYGEDLHHFALQNVARTTGWVLTLAELAERLGTPVGAKPE
jgi:nicotinamidase-related amidase